MKEILSVGKSIKIIRYLEKNEKQQKNLFEELIDFRKLFKIKLEQRFEGKKDGTNLDDRLR